MLAVPDKQRTMPKGYLTSHPPELFNYICDFVIAARPKQYLCAISKAFLPSAERGFKYVSAHTERAAVSCPIVRGSCVQPWRGIVRIYLRVRLPKAAFSSKAFAPMLRIAILHLLAVHLIEISDACELFKLLLSPTSPSTLPALVRLNSP
ncbi:hypothetical protein Rt10032_c14g5284 [Rhodotorula toruloides]|uniref:Uncharacterized protein n=1 Tax=Rhodotorula toruloides TaxID=5286 RepID=A0A511KLM7_RHOTO|nr:hypothetical protein Rt10032_c14g5284 [Rhodotorula toruloides]